MNHEQAEASLNTKLTQLNLAKNRVDGILAANNRAAIERQLEILKNLIRQTNEHRNTVEEMKISRNVRHEDIEAWHSEIEKKINEADREVARLSDWLNQPQNNENRAE